MSIFERIRRMIFPGGSAERDDDQRRLSTVEAKNRILVPRMDRLTRELMHAESVVAGSNDRRRRNLGHRPERRHR